VSNTVLITGIDASLPISIVGGEFSIDGGAFIATAGTLANGQTVTLRLTAAPTYGSMKTALLTIGAAEAGFSVTTQATAIAYSPASLSFASQALGIASAAQTVTLTNSGAATLNLGAVTVSGDFGQTNNCGTTLAAGASCSVAVTFTPTTTGGLIGRLGVASDGGNGAGVALSGTGAWTAGTRMLAQGWNLLGNGLDQPLPMAAQFADPNVVNSVWKWDAAGRRWLFHTPLMDAASLQAYATGKGYGVLTLIAPGEGYWVNAKLTTELAPAAGSAFVLAEGNLLPGWNLLATGQDVSPSAFNRSLSLTPPAPSVVPQNLVSLWAWDNPANAWYFYAPGLEAQGGTVLSDYITSKGYLDFTQRGKTLGNGAGFWVRRP
jgi:hypothetical protein